MREFDLIIIGAGPGGYETAVKAKRLGRNVLLIESGLPGGTCLNRGCIPTKALVQSAEWAATLKKFDAGTVIDFAGQIARKDSIVEQLRQGVLTELAGVELLHAKAEFVEPKVIEAAGEKFTAPQIIFATGSEPAYLPIPGSELAADSTEMLSCSELPDNLSIVGGGVIGMEFASVFSAFGVKVTVLEYCKEILPAVDADVAKRLRMALKRRGIDIITSAEVKSIEPGFTINYTSKGKECSVKASKVLMAVGRRPVLPPGLEKFAELDGRGRIKVDSQFRTSIEGVYAIGDCNGLLMLAHAASAQGEVVLGLRDGMTPVPSAVFTSPECAAVGLTEQQCREKEIDCVCGTATFRANGKALAMDSTDGMVKIIADRVSGQVLGCHICGPHAADLIAEPSLAMTAGITVAEMAKTIHAHPTLGEALQSAIRSLPHFEAKI